MADPTELPGVDSASSAAAGLAGGLVDLVPNPAREFLPRRAVEAVADLFEGEGEPPGVEAIVLAALAGGPATGREIALAIETEAPGFLSGREGWLYPVLHQMLREGRLEARWRERVEGRPRRQYAPPGGFPDPAPEPFPSAGPLPRGPLLERAARDATRSVADPFAREEARAEVLGHMADAAFAHGSLGSDPVEAARAAVRDLGDPWHIRADLARVHRGRRVVVFPHTLGERARALFRDEVLPLVVALALVLLLRWKVVQAYNIPTKSMEPTLYGSEDDADFILVNKLAYLLSPPERWDIVVFFPPHETGSRRRGDDEDDDGQTAFVKRCVGLPGDVLDIRGGDIHVDGVLVRRPADVEDAMMVEVYDLSREARDESADRVVANHWRELEGTWTAEGGRFVAVPSQEGSARLELRRHPVNNYRGADGKLVLNGSDVGDLEIRTEATPRDGTTRVGLVLREGTESYRFTLGPDGALLEGDGIGELRSAAARTRAGRPVELRLRNVDDRVTAWVDGAILFRVERPARAVVPELAAPGEAGLLVDGGGATFAGVRVLRDILYQRAGAGWPLTVPEGHLFMMGDNTASSNDSRMWGPARIADVIGSPFCVIYPLSRVRALR